MTDDQTKSPRSEAPLVPLFHTILATQNKSSELFVKSFQYQGENIATSHLGQIFGFFEIPDTQEDNAYIVNFLASVVKKEYFVNPKRSASDSFEAALHKINLALTELVKQGNTAWLGKLHGVVSVIANSTFHFSVTGDAAILLYRENQATLISEGLADKDAALHPLKTFLEISSGALLANDKILLSSPELFSLCEPETLRKNAFRMDKNGFARYVRAAIVNELPLGVSLIIDMEPGVAPQAPKKKSRALREASLEKLQNVFSGTSFAEEHEHQEKLLEDETSIAEPLEVPSEYTDHKTGHIYVQGQIPHTAFREPSGWQMFLEEWVYPLCRTIWTNVKRISKKSRKAVSKQASVLGTEGKELSRSFWQSSKEKTKLLAQKSNTVLKNKLASFQKEAAADLPEEFLPSAAFIEEESQFFEPNVPDAITKDSEPLYEDKRQAALHKFSPLYERPERNKGSKTLFFNKFFSALKERALKTPSVTFLFIVSVFARVKALSLRNKLFTGAGILLIIALLFFRGPRTEETVATPEESPSANQESMAEAEVTPTTLGSPSTLTSWDEGEAMLIVKNGTTTAVVSPKAITVNGKAFPFPAEGTVTSATYMTDLKLIFLWSSRNELVAWSLVDQKFTANTLPLPANTTVGGLGSYLTYLYVLDKSNGTIYRFARTEGGFGEGTSWLKTPLPKSSARSFVVTDVIRIAGPTLEQYLRGSKEKTLAEASYNTLGLSSEKNFTLAIETENGKIAIWNAEGSKVYEGVFEDLKGTTAVSYSESDKKLLVTKNQNLLEYSLSW